MSGARRQRGGFSTGVEESGKTLSPGGRSLTLTRELWLAGPVPDPDPAPAREAWPCARLLWAGPRAAGEADWNPTPARQAARPGSAG